MSSALLPPEQRIIRRLTERGVPGIQRYWVRASGAAGSRVDIELLAHLIASTGVAEMDLLASAVRIDTLIGTFELQLRPLLERLLKQAGEVGAPVFAETFRGSAGKVLDLDVFRSRAAGAARRLVGDAITLIDKAQREAIRAIIEEGYKLGRPPRASARAIEKLVGLDAARAGAQVKLVEALKLKPPPMWALREAYALRKRPEEFDAWSERYRRGLPAAQQRAWTDAAYARRLRSRGLAIARTETSAAARMAQNMIWEQAIEEGALDPAKWVKEWVRIPAARECPVCGPLQRKRTVIGGRYPGGLVGPPAHTHCLCGERLAQVRDGEEALPVAA